MKKRFYIVCRSPTSTKWSRCSSNPHLGLGFFESRADAVKALNDIGLISGYVEYAIVEVLKPVEVREFVLQKKTIFA